MFMIKQLFHQSSSNNRSSILEHGLLCEFDRTGYGAVFLCANPVEESGTDTWVVDISDLTIESDPTEAPDGEVWFVTYEDIPSASVRLLEGVEKKPTLRRR